MNLRKNLAGAGTALLLVSAMTGASLPGSEGEANPAPMPEFTVDSVADALGGEASNRRGSPAIQMLASGRSAAGNKESATDLFVMRSQDGSEALVDTTLLASTEPASRAVTAVGEGFVDLSWPDVSVSGEYDVSRDGHLIATVQASAFRDRKASPGDTHHYQVSTTVQKPQELWSAEERAEVESGKADPVSGQIWGFDVDMPEHGADSTSLLANVSAAATNSALMAIRYQTFIRPNTITADVPGSCKYTNPDYYVGDGRGFELNSFDYRTDSFGQVLWGAYGGSGFFRSDISTGRTLAYSADGTFLEAAQAVPTQTTHVMGSTPSTIDFRISFQAGDPFCYAGSIAVVYNASLTRTGSYAIGGTHRGAPDHQIVLERGDYDAGYNIISKRKFVYTREQASILCLVGGLCPELQIATQGTYE